MEEQNPPAPAGPDLRERLLGQPRNLELRTKYLATRTPEWAEADLRLAGERLLAVRVVHGIIGLALVGAAGGALGDLLLTPAAKASAAAAWPVVVALGSALSGAVSFAVLGALGCVVLPEVVGEEWESRHGPGFPGFLSRVREPLGDALCGGVWGALCGLFIGALSWAADILVGLPRFGPLDRAVAGTVGGVLLGSIFGMLIIVAGRKDSARARRWARLGPLPVHACFFFLQAARKRYLRK